MRSMILGVMILVLTVGFGLVEGSNPQAAGGVGLYFFSYLAAAIEHSGALLLIVGAVAITMRRDRGLDLSAGAVCVLAAAVMHLLSARVLFWPVAAPIGIGLAVGVGALNGLMIRRVRTAPMLITLAMMILAYCAALAIVKQTTAPPLYSNAALSMLSRPIVVGPVAVGLFIGLILLERFTPLMRNVGALYTLAGLIAGGAALVHLSAHGQCIPARMIDLELAALVAALLGGMRLTESRGSLPAAGLAAINLAVLREGCISLQVRLGDALPLDPRAVYLLALTGVALLILGIRWRNARRTAR
jgi:ribose/xylose/arabinose/galactoside ABC-type transport system permease subunit